MPRPNPTDAEHLHLIGELLASAERELDLAKAAFLGGASDEGWAHYLEAFREISRAQLEAVHAATVADDDDQQTLDDYIHHATVLDQMISSGITARVGSAAVLGDLFGAQARAVAHGDALSIPVGQYEDMRADLLRQLIARYGSVRAAADATGVPRSTMGQWLKEVREAHRARPERRRHRVRRSA